MPYVRLNFEIKDVNSLIQDDLYKIHLKIEVNNKIIYKNLINNTISSETEQTVDISLQKNNIYIKYSLVKDNQTIGIVYSYISKNVILNNIHKGYLYKISFKIIDKIKNKQYQINRSKSKNFYFVRNKSFSSILNNNSLYLVVVLKLNFNHCHGLLLESIDENKENNITNDECGLKCIFHKENLEIIRKMLISMRDTYKEKSDFKIRKSNTQPELLHESNNMRKLNRCSSYQSLAYSYSYIFDNSKFYRSNKYQLKKATLLPRSISMNFMNKLESNPSKIYYDNDSQSKYIKSNLSENELNRSININNNSYSIYSSKRKFYDTMGNDESLIFMNNSPKKRDVDYILREKYKNLKKYSNKITKIMDLFINNNEKTGNIKGNNHFFNDSILKSPSKKKVNKDNNQVSYSQDLSLMKNIDNYSSSKIKEYINMFHLLYDYYKSSYKKLITIKKKNIMNLLKNQEKEKNFRNEIDNSIYKKTKISNELTHNINKNVFEVSQTIFENMSFVKDLLKKTLFSKNAKNIFEKTVLFNNINSSNTKYNNEEMKNEQDNEYNDKKFTRNKDEYIKKMRIDLNNKKMILLNIIIKNIYCPVLSDNQILVIDKLIKKYNKDKLKKPNLKFEIKNKDFNIKSKQSSLYRIDINGDVENQGFLNRIDMIMKESLTKYLKISSKSKEEKIKCLYKIGERKYRIMNFEFSVIEKSKNLFDLKILYEREEMSIDSFFKLIFN